MAVREQDQLEFVQHVQVADLEVVLQLARHRHVTAEVLLDVLIRLAKAGFGKLGRHGSCRV